MKDIIVNYVSKGREDYFSGQMKLIRSVVNSDWDGDCLFYAEGGYCDEYMGHKILLEFPSQEKFAGHHHSEIPYQFKYVAIQAAREKGYERIFWLDASMRVVKNVSELFDESETGIVSFHNLGHETWKYISDIATQNLGITEKELMEIPQTWGGAIGFDFTKPAVEKIFDEILKQSAIGSFTEATSSRSGFVAHRHDQAVNSVIFYKNDIVLLPYGKLVGVQHTQEPYEFGKDYYLVCGGE